MGLFNKIVESVTNKVADEVVAVEAALDGKPGQLIAENTLSVLDGCGQTGDILQRESGDIFDFAIDTAQGEDVGLEYDPEVLGEIGEALPGDIGDALETYFDLL